jgi:anti-sigma regulatory factor (Ser/Thr protein kinase)
VSIYSKKQGWKLFLVILAGVIVLVSLWYTNVLVRKVAKEERKKVELWAQAIRKKTKLVNYTAQLFDKLGVEEEKKVRLWAEATELLIQSDDLPNYNFILNVVQYNTTIPVIVTSQSGQIKSYRNLNKEFDLKAPEDIKELEEMVKGMKERNEPIRIAISKNNLDYMYFDDSQIIVELKSVLNDLVQSFISEIVVNSALVPVIYTDSSQAKVIDYGNIDSSQINNPIYLAELIIEMKAQNTPIEVNLEGRSKNYIFYKDSDLLIQLKYYPFFQFGVIGFFLLLAYYLFSIARRSEQNQVWVGMAKETAHQLGTPLSSLMAWTELLRSKNVDEATITEIGKDLQRLETITERFSKIGSSPKLDQHNVLEVVEKTWSYLKPRLSSRIEFSISKANGQPILAQMNQALFEWVLENMIKNAVDAMEGSGSITVSLTDQTQFVYIDISDSGKGIPRKTQKTVFEPGYTTKKRGWGLGLSLVKRIIENYHDGKVFVKSSEKTKGTTFRIVLNK